MAGFQEEDHDDLLEFILKYNKDMQGEGMDGKRTPLDGRQLRRYIASMREVVEAYKKTMLEITTVHENSLTIL